MRSETEQADQSWVAQGGDDLLAGALLVVRGDGVLEVEHDDVGAQCGRLLEHAQVAAGDGELGAVEAGSHVWHGRRQCGPLRRRTSKRS